MAVENKWVNAYVEAGGRGNPANIAGGKKVALAGTFEIAAADSDASIFKLAKLPANAIPVRAEIYCDAITGMTSLDLGLYKENGDVADANLFAAALDLNAGVAITAAANNGLTALPLADVGEKLWELLGKTVDTKEEGYVLAITANTIGSAAGTISYVFEYILG